MNKLKELIEWMEEVDAPIGIIKKAKQLQSEDGWISVSERLPEPCLEVICFTENGYGVEFLYYDGDRKFYTHSDSQRSPTHWQPLPEKPKQP